MVLVEAAPDLIGTGRGLAGFRGREMPRAPWLQGPPGFSRGRPGPRRTGMGLLPRGESEDPWDTCESNRLLEDWHTSIVESEKVHCYVVLNFNMFFTLLWSLCNGANLKPDSWLHQHELRDYKLNCPEGYKVIIKENLVSFLC